MALIDTIVTAYAFTQADIDALETVLYEQLTLAYMEQLRALAKQHGVQNPNVVLGASEAARLREKAHEDAVGIAETYNNDLRDQITAIFENNPQATREDVTSVLSSWGRNRAEYKSIQVAMYTILWSANYGFDLFITRNNLTMQLFRAVGGIPVCPDCIDLVGYG